MNARDKILIDHICGFCRNYEDEYCRIKGYLVDILEIGEPCWEEGR